MNESTCLILHRKSANRPEVKEAVKAVRASGIPLRVRIPWNKKDKAAVVREAIAGGVTRLIAGGGDGTINAVVNALVGGGKGKTKGKVVSGVEIGILPLGTANDFARGCGLPVDDLTECLKIACTEKSRPMDVGRMNKHFFINVASLGFGAEVTATTPQDLKSKLGGAAYTLMGLATALKFKPYPCQLTIPGKPPLAGEMLIGAVGNSRFAGGGFEVAPAARLDDGLLDVAFLAKDAEFSLTKVISELKDPFNAGNRYVIYRQLAEFTLESTEELFCNLDGEPSRRRKLKFSVLPGRLRLVRME